MQVKLLLAVRVESGHFRVIKYRFSVVCGLIYRVGELSEALKANLLISMPKGITGPVAAHKR